MGWRPERLIPVCLVLDTEQYRYQAFMSDIAGQDIEAHGGDVATLIGKVRLFLNAGKRGAPLPSGASLAADYERFREALPGMCADLDLDAESLAFKDLVWVMGAWAKAE